MQVVISEIHVLAYCYHWSEKSLWEMPRKRRNLWCRIVLEQKKAEDIEDTPSAGKNTSLSKYKENV